MHHDYWATPTYDAPIVPPGHVDSNCPIWLSPHTYKPLHYGIATRDAKHVTCDEWAKITERNKALVAVLISKAGVAKINDDEYLLSELESKVAPLFPPKDYVAVGEIRMAMPYSRATWAQSIISKEKPDWTLHQYKYFSPEHILIIERMILEYKEKLCIGQTLVSLSMDAVGTLLM